MSVDAAPSPVRLYIVQFLHWEYNDEWFALEEDEPVRAYVSREDAEAARREIEQRHRAEWTGKNLIESFERGSLTPLSDSEFRDRLIAAGAPLPPPDDRYEDNLDLFDSKWWDALWSTLPEETVWELFDGLRFSEVVEIEAV